VTLPLSYSRLRGSLASLTRRYGATSPPQFASVRNLRQRRLPRHLKLAAPGCRPTGAHVHPHGSTTELPMSPVALLTEARVADWLADRVADWLANRSSRSERRLVARGGFEPPKPLGRQIYSLLRLTASLPRRYRGPQHAMARTKYEGERGKLGALLSIADVPANCLDFRRCATSPAEPCSKSLSARKQMELAKGFEPPTG
jgi:hypothetical protein